MNFEHISVLLEECITGLDIKPDGIYVDGTLGGAGHASHICQKLNKDGHFIGIDQDNNALAVSKERLSEVEPKVDIVKSNFSDLDEVLGQVGVPKIDGMLIDLGVSSHQLDEASRGFSYMQEAKLDMRMNQDSELCAYKVVNEYSEDELHEIIKNFGEERWAKRVASFIIEHREKKPIETTFELVDIIKRAIPQKARQEGSHPAKRTFQAIRIEVNREIDIIAPTIKKAVDALNSGGRLCIITFHSLEDRIVKHTFKSLAESCICDRNMPICVCDQEPVVKVISRKPILPTKDELENNSRSKSAKLRIVEKL
ncbi:MAG: 16S rRNA (cytosine(1402)-N(4))-methyltransferase [Epulopiscium sp. Nele67-Bin005]|nr:MAG: 16S rRNA (cytosine(1402)-N(4))-methyltransferase [Epulopiscium sp. Nele67-Bin005]